MDTTRDNSNDRRDPAQDAEALIEKIAHDESILLNMGHIDPSQVTVRGRSNSDIAARNVEQKQREERKKTEQRIILVQQLQQQMDDFFEALDRKIAYHTNEINKVEQSAFSEEELETFAKMSPADALKAKEEALRKKVREGTVTPAELESWLMHQRERAQTQITRDNARRDWDNAKTVEEKQAIIEKYDVPTVIKAIETKAEKRPEAENELSQAQDLSTKAMEAHIDEGTGVEGNASDEAKAEMQNVSMKSFAASMFRDTTGSLSKKFDAVKGQEYKPETDMQLTANIENTAQAANLPEPS